MNLTLQNAKNVTMFAVTHPGGDLVDNQHLIAIFPTEDGANEFCNEANNAMRRNGVMSLMRMRVQQVMVKVEHAPAYAR